MLLNTEVAAANIFLAVSDPHPSYAGCSDLCHGSLNKGSTIWQKNF